MQRNVQSFKGCTLVRESGPARYFGHPDYPRVRIQYRTRRWRVLFPNRTYCLCGTIAEAREYVARVGYRNGVAA